MVDFRQPEARCRWRGGGPVIEPDFESLPLKIDKKSLFSEVPSRS